MRKKSRKKGEDAQLKEFETRDLGEDIAKSRSAAVIRRKVHQLPTSILLDPAMVEKLRFKASKRGIGYQTMLKIIVHEHVDEY